MHIDQACDNYLQHLQVERNLSPRTVESYGHDLLLLREHLAGAGVSSVHEITHKHLTAWLQGWGERGLQASSQSRARSAVRQLFLFLRREHVLAVNPAADLTAPKLGRPLPVYPNEDEAARMLDLAVAATPRGLRDRAALELLYGSGLRASEVCFLRLDDLYLDQGLVRPRGKGDKERLVPVGEPAREAILAYLQHGRPALLRDGTSDYVFIGNCCQPLSRMALFKMVRRYGLQAGVRRALSPHKLRHAFATHLVRGGADLRSVQQLLGHASIATTEVYTHVAHDELRDVVDEHHPLGRRPRDK